MPQGLQVMDSSGNVVVDLSTRLARVLGSFRVTANGSISDPALATGTPFIMVMPEAANPVTTFFSSNYQPLASVSGTTITYTYHGISGVVVYGVY